MSTIAFDSLAYFDKLKAAGVPEEQARIQADVFLSFAQSQEEKLGQDLVTKTDLQSTELQLRQEIQTTELKLRQEIQATELRLQKEIKALELRLLKWQLGIGLAIIAIIAKGFGWLGF